MDNNKICFIRAKLKDDYCFDAIKRMGYQIYIPYRDKNLLWRCMRETWYRLHLPHKEWWFNKQLRNIDADVFIIYDPLVIPELVNWVGKHYPEKKVLLCYENRANNTINPSIIEDPKIEKWSYDNDDCRKYGMQFMHGSYLDIYRLDKKQPVEYDILYLGRDKGRAKKLFELENTFKNLGLKTYFHICADRQHLRFKKPYYKPLLSYRDYLKLLSKTRAILNIMPEGQTSITMRDFEALFNEIKEITNNKGIRDYDFYDPSRFFILGEDEISKLPEFLNSDFKPISESMLDEYKFENSINQMISLK